MKDQVPVARKDEYDITSREYVGQWHEHRIKKSAAPHYLEKNLNKI